MNEKCEIEKIVKLLYDAAIEYEGTKNQGVFCRAGDILISITTTIKHIRNLSEENNGSSDYGTTGYGQIMEWCDIHLKQQD